MKRKREVIFETKYFDALKNLYTIKPTIEQNITIKEDAECQSTTRDVERSTE
jgi:hypothetical protein